MHVSVCGERHAADAALEGPLAGVNQHVTIQRTRAAQLFGTDATSVRMIGRIMLANVYGERMLRFHFDLANRASPLACHFVLCADEERDGQLD